MRFIRFLSEGEMVPVYVARDEIAAVIEGQVYNMTKRRDVGTGKAEILVQGEWMRLEQSPADVMRMLGEPA